MTKYALPLLLTSALLGAGCMSSTQVDTAVNTNAQIPAPAPAPEQPTMDDSMKMDDTGMDADVNTDVDAKVDVGDTKVDVGEDAKVTVKTVNVAIQNFAYAQTSLTVKKGDKVVFTNKDSVQHTVTADGGAFSSGMLSTNSSFTVDTSKLAPGTYSYHCTPHPNMKGTIIVQ